MDGDAISPNPFCSAPPHSEPPPPLLPLSSVTPSCTNDGIPGRTSGHIQGVGAQTAECDSQSGNTGADLGQEPSIQNPPPTKRQREGGSMVSQSEQLRVESAQVHVKQNEGGLECSYTAEHTHNQMEQEIHATGNVAEHCAYNSILGHTDIIRCDMDTSQGLDTLLENGSAPKGWVIGPLFQSFKSKMASFTDIVMSPVKLFKAQSPPPSMEHPENLGECELPADGPADVGHLEPGGRNDISENVQNTKTVNIKCLKILSFGEELSTPSLEKSNECAKTCQEPVPLQHSPVLCFPTETVSECVDALLQDSVGFSASHESKLASTVNEDKLKPLPRIGSESNPLASEFKEKCDLEADNCGGIDKTVPLSSSSCNTQSDIGCLQPDGDEGINMESCHSIQQSLHFSSNSVNGRTVKPGKDLQEEEEEAAYSATGCGRAKRRLKLACHVTVNMCTHDAKQQELMNVASGHDLTKEPSRRAVCTRTAVGTVKTLKATTKRKAHSTSKDKGGQEMLPTVIGAMLKTETEGSPEAIFVCSLDKSSGVPENLQSVFSSINRSPIVVCKRLKIRAGLVKPELSIDDGMDLETTVAISSAKEEVEELSLEALVRPDIKPHQVGHRKCNKKPLKRKSAVTEPDLVSASSVEPTDLNVPPPVQRENSLKTSLNGSPKRKRRPRAALKSSESAGGQENKRGINNIKATTRKRQPPDGRSTISKTPVYFEMTPAPLCSQPPASRPALLSKEVKDVAHESEKRACSLGEEVFPTDTDASGLSSRARSHLNIRPRRGDKQRSKARVLHSRTREGAEMLMSASMDVATAPRNPPEHGLSGRLLRSYSCPEIPSFRSLEAPPPPSRTPASHHHQSSHTPHVPHPRKSAQRARRHTVCSVEVEREIAPLCLRKEVYPSRRSAPYDIVAQHLSPTIALSPSITLSALASCFLSSPLAFLSKKVDSRSAAASPSTSHVSPPTFCSSKSPVFLHTAASSHATLDPGSSTNSLECEPEPRQQCQVEDGEDTSCSSQDYEDIGLREEKALSDSEIKVVQKHEERGKVSSIRIRKTLPKPQNNLTPMGLPKPVRLKKKDFSVEEIYTNKNFSKPPESRLETIFEVPLSRRNGSESLFGQRRFKRFLQFLEAGEVRKPKKPLVGVGKPAVSSSRTRRGVFSKEEASLAAQDVDSLLCAKLDELNLWLIKDQSS